MKTLDTFTNEIRTSIATRRAYEIAKSADCTSMLDTLKAFDTTLARDAVVALLFSTNVDSNILNRQERNSARFNVYAFDKVTRDASQATMNHYSKAIFKAAILLKKADLQLTHADAVYVCSLDAKHKDHSRAKILKGARYEKHVALTTASTQSSSSINSLQALNMLTESRDSANHVCYTLADNEHTNAQVALFE